MSAFRGKGGQVLIQLLKGLGQGIETWDGINGAYKQ